jgi:hypothetical protein
VIHDAACPPGLAPAVSGVERLGVFYTSARWTPDSLAALALHLDVVGAAALARLPAQRLLAAWSETVERFRLPETPESAAVRPALARFSGLSLEGLDAALEAVLGGVDRAVASRLVAAARDLVRDTTSARGLVAVILAGNLPALAVQSLLPALALGRPVLLKSPHDEPLFAPAFVRALQRAEPQLESAVAAVTWKGGSSALEAPVFARAATVLAYGEQETIDSIAVRSPGRCVAYGPKTSLAIVAAGAELESVAAGLARDIALFDQRGCLSIQAIYTDADAPALAAAVAQALARQAEQWPPGALDPRAVAGVQQLRLEARLRGLAQADLDIAIGTVVIDPLPEFRPSPGLRSVRIHPLHLAAVVPCLEPWRGRLQGAALAGSGAWQLEPALSRLGVSRCAAPGQLQAADALWHNGGVHPFEALGARLAVGPVAED